MSTTTSYFVALTVLGFVALWIGFDLWVVLAHPPGVSTITQDVRAATAKAPFITFFAGLISGCLIWHFWGL